MSGKLRWLSVAFIEYVSEDGKKIIFDPWTSTQENDLCPYSNEEFKDTDVILVSHDHYDHIASAASICHQSNALLGGPDETMKRLMKDENLKPESIANNGAGYIVGGGFELDWLTVISTPANHTSNTSMALGTIVILKNGFTIYHSGDTSITAEMEIYGRLFPIDIAFIPVFQQSIMGYIQATEAVRLLNPKKVFPIHFDFNKDPVFERDRFVEYCRQKNPDVEIIKTEKDVWYDV